VVFKIIIMKKLIIISISLFTFLNIISADTEKEIKGIIKHVTVYPDRAQVNQETMIDIPVGKSVLKLSNLSPYIDAQSIQVKGYGDFIILSVNHQNNYLQNLESSPEMKSIRSQIESLQIKVEDEKAATNVLKEKEAFLTANRTILVKESTFSIEQLKSVMELYTSNMEQVTMTVLKKGRLIKDYEKQIAALQQQISSKLGIQKLPSGEISVTVTSEKPVSGKMSLSYVVNNTGWYPSYDIRVDNITKPVTIVYKANVYQNTGNEWKDVKLSFSNATPWVAGDIPVQYPWFVDFYNPAPVALRSKASGISRSDAPMMKEQVASFNLIEEKLSEAAPVAVEKRIGETTITFDVALPYTIPSDGKFQTIEIQNTATSAEYKYVTVPKLSTMAYLTANITDWAKQSLQSGEATLYFENSFVGRSTLNVNQLTDTLMLSLGTDNSLLIKREKRKDYSSRKIVGTNKTETYSFLITVRNNKSIPVKITVNDQIPVSSNSDITVEPGELTGGKLDSQTGYIKWDLDIKPQEIKELILTYSVKYPKNKNIILD
jgi:uncharacterized protein (TIGR02231 family)